MPQSTGSSFSFSKLIPTFTWPSFLKRHPNVPAGAWHRILHHHPPDPVTPPE
jgi:hypothetical protein